MTSVSQHSSGSRSGPPIENANNPDRNYKLVHILLESASKVIDESGNLHPLAWWDNGMNLCRGWKIIMLIVDYRPFARRDGRLNICWRREVMVVIDRLSLRPDPSSAFVLRASCLDQCYELGAASSNLDFELGHESLDLDSLRWNGSANLFKSRKGLAGLGALSSATASWSSRP